MVVGCKYTMISIDELNEIKEKRKTNLYFEEKEYLQYIFLYAISKYPENFIFKGGTCLRICYGLERASEDLDFSTNLSISEIKKIVAKCLKEFDALNISYNIYSEKSYRGNIRIEVRFNGPLFQGDSRSANTLKIDFNKQKVKNKVAKVAQKLFSDVPLFTIVALDEKEILAEKIRALMTRTRARDLFDVNFLLEKNIYAEESLIVKKMSYYNNEFKVSKLMQKIRSLDKIWKKELWGFASEIPNFQQTSKEVIKKLKKKYNEK